MPLRVVEDGAFSRAMTPVFGDEIFPSGFVERREIVILDLDERNDVLVLLRILTKLARMDGSVS
jgi:hypothetical protein